MMLGVRGQGMLEAVFPPPPAASPFDHVRFSRIAVAIVERVPPNALARASHFLRSVRAQRHECESAGSSNGNGPSSLQGRRWCLARCVDVVVSA
jgi:hypothetical protein